VTDELSPEDLAILRGDDPPRQGSEPASTGRAGDETFDASTTDKPVASGPRPDGERDVDDSDQRSDDDRRDALLSRWRTSERLPRDRRALLLMALVIVSALILLAARSAEPQPVVPFGAGETPPLPVASPVGTATSTWVCPVVQTSPDGVVTSAIHVANIADARLSGSVRFLSSDGAAPDALPVQLEPGTDGRIVVPASARPLAAVVELVGGVGIVEQTVSSPLGTSTSACASSASQNWYLAAGSTLRTTQFDLVIANPFAVDAVVDITFASATALIEPPALQGYVIPAGTVGIVDVSGSFRREELVSTSLTSRRGRVVAGRWQRNDGVDGGRRGQFAGLASPSTSPHWWFAGGTVDVDVTEQLVISNPSQQRAELEVLLYPADQSQAPFAVPVTSLRAGGVATVPISAAAGVPTGRHQISVRSPNGVPVVAERLIDVTGTRPSASNQLGSPRLANAWWFVAGEAREGSSTTVTVANPSGVAVTVRLRRQVNGALVELSPPANVTVPPGGSLDIAVTDGTTPGANANLAVLVQADGPIVVERRWFRGERGTSRSLGIPTRTSIAAPPLILDINGEPIDWSTPTTSVEERPS
jgi:hypothetical protein